MDCIFVDLINDTKRLSGEVATYAKHCPSLHISYSNVRVILYEWYITAYMLKA